MIENKLISVIIGTAVVSAVWKVFEHRTQQDANRKMAADKERTNYEQIHPLQVKAVSICRKWTGTPCTSDDDIRKFIRLYAEQRALQIHKVPVKSNPQLQQETEEIHDYSRKFMEFFNKKDYTLTDRYPTCGDYKAFLTFHWALYTANNVSKEPSPYPKYKGGQEDLATHSLAFAWMKKHHCNSEIQEIDDFQKAIRPQFLAIQRDIYPKK